MELKKATRITSSLTTYCLYNQQLIKAIFMAGWLAQQFVMHALNSPSGHLSFAPSITLLALFDWGVEIDSLDVSSGTHGIT